MYINPLWSYKDLVSNLKALRSQYEEILASFNILHDRSNFIRETRTNLYSLSIKEFEKDNVWEYMNGYLSPIAIVMIFGFWEEDEDESDNELID